MQWLIKLRTNLRKHYQLYLLLLPGFAVIILFNYVPMWGIQLAFREFSHSSGIAGGAWVGLKYFEKFTHSHQFWPLLINTLSISVTTIVCSFPVPVILALMFCKLRNQRRKKVMQTIVYLPHFISIVVMVGMIQLLLSPTSGIIGHLASDVFGYTGNLMGDKSAFVPIYVITEIWQHAGWNAIIYIAALSSIDMEIYDACSIDGANTWQTIWHIDLPSLRSTMVILLILNMGGVLSVGFEKVYLMQNSLNISVSEIINTYVYKIGLQKNQYSYSAAVNLFNTAVNFLLVFITNFISKRAAGISLW